MAKSRSIHQLLLAACEAAIQAPPSSWCRTTSNRLLDARWRLGQAIKKVLDDHLNPGTEWAADLSDALQTIYTKGFSRSVLYDVLQLASTHARCPRDTTWTVLRHERRPHGATHRSVDGRIRRAASLKLAKLHPDSAATNPDELGDLLGLRVAAARIVPGPDAHLAVLVVSHGTAPTSASLSKKLGFRSGAWQIPKEYDATPCELAANPIKECCGT